MATISEISADSSKGGLPPSSYDGSHLPWNTFRQHVLAPHRIRISETPPRDKLPSTLVAMIESEISKAAKYEAQKALFRDQVDKGCAFGPSPLFPPNLLPHIDHEPRLARCMVPSFSRDALPERAINQMGPFYQLSIPRSGLGCGFSCSVFTAEELSILPSWLVCTGTVVHFDTGYISPGAGIYCPFLIFERAWGDKEHRLEAANNQCAIGGAWCIRAMQMLYAQAWKGQMIPESPIAFSCSIDNNFAILNIHWIDHGQAYCMAPLCNFDLTQDDHFSSFLVWIDSIGKWGVNHLLPSVQRALERLRAKETTPPPTPRATKLTLDTDICPNEQLIKSLKNTFENIPWRFEDDEFTPVSSSTASWGSPLIDIPLASLDYPPVPRRTLGGTPTSAILRKQYFARPSHHLTPPPAYTQNPELLWQIRDLQRQVQALKSDLSGATTSFQKELSEVKTMMDSVLRKETFAVRNRSLSLNMQETWSTQTLMGSPLVNEVHPDLVVKRGPLSFPLREKAYAAPLSPKFFVPGFQTNGLPSPAMPSPSLLSPSMPSPTFSIYSQTTNIVSIPPAPPVATSIFKFTGLMVSGHMLGMFIQNVLLRIFVLGVVTDISMLAFISVPISPVLQTICSHFGGDGNQECQATFHAP